MREREQQFAKPDHAEDGECDLGELECIGDEVLEGEDMPTMDWSIIGENQDAGHHP